MITGTIMSVKSLTGGSFSHKPRFLLSPSYVTIFIILVFVSRDRTQPIRTVNSSNNHFARISKNGEEICFCISPTGLCHFFFFSGK